MQFHIAPRDDRVPYRVSEAWVRFAQPLPQGRPFSDNKLCKRVLAESRSCQP
jgi:hypothetical protein